MLRLLVELGVDVNGMGAAIDQLNGLGESALQCAMWKQRDAVGDGAARGCEREEHVESQQGMAT